MRKQNNFMGCFPENIMSVYTHLGKLKKIDKMCKMESEDITSINNMISTIFEDAQDGVFIKDLQGRYIIVNLTSAKMMGKAVEEMLHKDDNQLFPNKVAQKMIEIDREVLNSGKPKISEESIFFRGKPVALVTVRAPYRDKQGNVIGVIGIARDITGHKKTKKVFKNDSAGLELYGEEPDTKLFEANKLLQKKSAGNKLAEKTIPRGGCSTVWGDAEKYRVLFESSTDGIIFTDMKGCFVDINQAYLDMLDYTQTELKKIKVQDVTPRKWRKMEADLIREHIEAGKNTYTFEKKCIRKDGTVFPVAVIAGVIKDEDRKPLYLWSIIRDVTGLKEAEKNLKESELTLMKQKLELEQKTAALTEVIAQIEIEKDKIKDNVVTNMAEVVFPVLAKLKLNPSVKEQVELIEYHLKELYSSFGHKITERSIKLTSREIEICNMIKAGLSSKEIARLLNISSMTVDRHRRNIRDKLGISNKDVNLASYLHNL